MRSVELYKDLKLRSLISINEDAKIIYLRSPRTASSSILRLFLEKNIPGFIDFKYNLKECEKWSNKITEDKLKDYFIFVSIRDPYDRAVSMANSGLVNMKLKKFLNNYNSLFLEDYVDRMHIEPYSTLGYYDNKKQFDFEIRFENLEDDFSELCKIIQTKQTNLKKTAASKHKFYKTYYDKECIKLVNNIYKNDFKFFNYKMVNEF